MVYLDYFVELAIAVLLAVCGVALRRYVLRCSDSVEQEIIKSAAETAVKTTQQMFPDELDEVKRDFAADLLKYELESFSISLDGQRLESENEAALKAVKLSVGAEW